MLLNLFVGIQLFRPLCTELYKQIMYKALFTYLCYAAGFSLFNAWHCLSMAGGVKWRKLGIFINSAFANLPGGVAPGTTQPWCNGNGTLAGWKDLATGHTEGQSWSVGILLERGGWTGALLYTFRPYDLIFNDLLGLRSSERNSSSPNQFEQKAGYSTCHSRVK